MCSLGKNRPGFWKSGAIKILGSAVSVLSDLLEAFFYFPEFGFEDVYTNSNHFFFVINFLSIIKFPIQVKMAFCNTHDILTDFIFKSQFDARDIIFQLVKPCIHPIEPFIDLVKALIHPIEPIIHPVKSFIHLSQLGKNQIKFFIFCHIDYLLLISL